MLQSKLFSKTLKTAPKDAETISHKYLTRGGFINQLASGIYSFLPLGFKVYKKIENIIREEMKAIDGQELYLPVLQPKKLWQESGRWDTIDPPLFKLKDRHGKELALGPTHEEVLTDLARQYIKSYKDLPQAVFQIQNKFRNEMRATGGLLRVREFVMKDLYSFHTSEKNLDNYYEKVAKTYKKIYERCDLKAVMVQASSGTIGGKISHEFMVIAKDGEDKILVCQKCDWAGNLEISKNIKVCPICQGKIKQENSIEAGHIFQLGITYSERMGANFIDLDGKSKPIFMGCYGIGLGRLLATIVEASNDQNGIIWPETVAPFKVQLLTLGQNKQVLDYSNKIYQQLLTAGIEVLYDDRENITAGEKFADADLIGIPYRLIISEKTKDEVEVKKRGEKQAKLMRIEGVIKLINQ